MKPDISAEEHRHFLSQALQMAIDSIGQGRGGPFAAFVVKDGVVIGSGINRVLEKNDPSAHAEIEAIRDACHHLGHYQLDGCILYSSCEPCPMCLGAIYWARPALVVYAASRQDASEAGFDDSFIYSEFNKAPEIRKIPLLQMLEKAGRETFKRWAENPEKRLY